MTDRELLELEAKIERLQACLKTANANHEHFEREWYLRGDEIERLQAAAREVSAARIYLREREALLKNLHQHKQQIALLREALESAATVGGFAFGVAKKALAATEEKK